MTNKQLGKHKTDSQRSQGRKPPANQTGARQVDWKAMRAALEHLASASPASLLTTQRAYGNRAVTQAIQRAAAMGAGGGAVDEPTQGAIEAARGGGAPLPAKVGAQVGRALGADFSSVKVHTDAQADVLNHQLSARAFTRGRDIFFRQGAYAPGSASGQRLLAHELTHVVQQGSAQPVPAAVVQRFPIELPTKPKPRIIEITRPDDVRQLDEWLHQPELGEDELMAVWGSVRAVQPENDEEEAAKNLAIQLLQDAYQGRGPAETKEVSRFQPVEMKFVFDADEPDIAGFLEKLRQVCALPGMKNHPLQEFLEEVQQAFNEKPLTVQLVQSKTFLATDEESIAEGEYDATTRRIRLALKIANPGQTFLHELMHFIISVRHGGEVPFNDEEGRILTERAVGEFLIFCDRDAKQMEIMLHLPPELAQRVLVVLSRYKGYRFTKHKELLPHFLEIIMIMTEAKMDAMTIKSLLKNHLPTVWELYVQSKQGYRGAHAAALSASQ